MALHPPKLQDLEICLPEIQSTGITEYTTKKIWDIDVPINRGIGMPIFLSYVFHTKYEILEDQFERVLGNDVEIKNSSRIYGERLGEMIKPMRLKNQVTRFNPFKNRYGIFFKKDVVRAIDVFCSNLNKHVDKKASGTQCRLFLYLETASEILNCRIHLFATEPNETMKLHTFPKVATEAISTTGIIIFQHSYKSITGSVTEDFGFGMTENHAEKLRRAALIDILTWAKLDVTDIRNIEKESQCYRNFLQFLLRSSNHDFIRIIYASPYIPLKLSEAGFNTDPCSLEPSGFSAFHDCMILKDTERFWILYNHAVNGFFLSDKSTRQPDINIKEAIEKVGKIIKDECHAYFGLDSDKRFMIPNTTREILKFNEFQQDVASELCGIIGECSENIKPEQRKNIILSLLSAYLANFYIDVKNSTDNGALFENYIKLKGYYENLDNYTCLVFFDNILQVKALQDTACITNAAFSLFLTVLSYKYFGDCKHNLPYKECDICKNCSPNVNSCPLWYVPFTERQNFLRNAKELKVELKQDSNLQVNTKQMVLTIKDCLANKPEIKDEFLISKLYKYLDATQSISLQSSGMKGVLTIQRTLQVIGETLNTSSDTNTVVGHLLCSCLPAQLRHELFCIRNHCLSHYRLATHSRVKLEKEDSSWFKNVQKEVNDLSRLFNCVRINQAWRLEELMLDRCEAENAPFHEVWEGVFLNRNEIRHLRLSLFERLKDKYQSLSRGLLTYIQDIWQSDGHQKMNQIKGGLRALKLIFDNINKVNSRNPELLSAVQGTENFLQTYSDTMNVDERENFTKHFKQHILSLEDELNSAFDQIQPRTKSTAVKRNFGRQNNSFDFTELCSYRTKLFSNVWFAQNEIDLMKITLDEELKISSDILKFIQKDYVDYFPTSQMMERILKSVFLSEKRRKVLLNIFTRFEKQKNSGKTDMKTLIESSTKCLIKEIDSITEEYEKYSFNNINSFVEFMQKDECLNFILNANFPAELTDKISRFCIRKLELLLDRINYLKNILIEEDDEINSLWKWGHSKALKKHMKFLMCRRFITETDFRASLEMLLFDCHSILIDRKDLENLWTKTNQLFSGISLRDVLSHGNIILETVGGLLDPEDLPNEFISKMLELIEDGEVIEAILKLYIDVKPKRMKDFRKVINEPGRIGDIFKSKEAKLNSYVSLINLKG